MKIYDFFNLFLNQAYRNCDVSFHALQVKTKQKMKKVHPYFKFIQFQSLFAEKTNFRICSGQKKQEKKLLEHGVEKDEKLASRRLFLE